MVDIRRSGYLKYHSLRTYYNIISLTESVFFSVYNTVLQGTLLGAQLLFKSRLHATLGPHLNLAHLTNL